VIVLQGPPETWDVPDAGSAVAIGVFDGVHLGHRAVLGALDEAGAGTKVALTFGTHPARILAAEPPPMLNTLKERIVLLGAAGVDRVAVLDFDSDMVASSPEEFVERVLVDGLNAKFVAVGEGFRFGHAASGSTETLSELGRRHGFTVAVVPILTNGGEEIRSTGIRLAIAAGDVERAATLLGHPHRITGVVVPGEGRGATVGIPTANVSFPTGLAVPRRGVYAVYAVIDGARLPAVANLGVRPTFGGDQEVLEVHVIGEDLDLRGREIGVDFVHRLRDEQRFDDVDALVDQIQTDIGTAKAMLGEVPQTS
jgi:riboflavin kinase / FMN adenylyltransferase